MGMQSTKAIRAVGAWAGAVAIAALAAGFAATEASATPAADDVNAITALTLEGGRILDQASGINITIPGDIPGDIPGLGGDPALTSEGDGESGDTGGSDQPAATPGAPTIIVAAETETENSALFSLTSGAVIGGGQTIPTIVAGSATNADLSGAVVIPGQDNGGEQCVLMNTVGGQTVSVFGASALTVSGDTIIDDNSLTSNTVLTGGILINEGCTGAIAIEGGAIANALPLGGDIEVLNTPAIQVLSPDADVTIGTEGGDGPSIVTTGKDVPNIEVVDGAAATIESGFLVPDRGQAVVAPSVTAAVAMANASGNGYQAYGQELIDRLPTGSMTSAAILVASDGSISLPNATPGLELTDATDSADEIAVVTPYGVVVVTAETPGVVPGLPEEAVTVHRMYNPYLDGAHLLTGDENEVETLKAAGWVDEGARFTEYKEPSGAVVSVFRLYNPNNSDHFFTASEHEAETLETLGWTREGIGWYAPPETTLPAYRLYNPYQTEFDGLGNHLWTTLLDERDGLIKAGWESEGIGWYAMPLA